MGYLKQLVLEDFKSWRGRQLIGPFKRFNCVIGPNGSGKSNLMDALSFVMGEKTSNLRVKSVKELIHGANIGKPVSSTASVHLVYCEDDGEEKTFSRIIVGNSSEYRFNERILRRSAYILELEKIGIIVKARNCLVFQGEVESIAMKKPKERTCLFEQISNSWELAEEYEKKKKLMLQADEDAQFIYNKKKNVAVERRQAKLEKEEADHYQMLSEQLKQSKTQLQLFQLFHNERKIDSLEKSLEEKNIDTNSQKEQLSISESALKNEKKELGRLSRNLQQIENEIKAKEISLNHSRPQYIKAKENTAHHLKKIETTQKSLKNNEKRFVKLEQDIGELEEEVGDIQKAWQEFEKKVEEDLKTRHGDVELVESQLDQYRLLKEEARKKSAVLGQQLEKLQWEQRADQEKLIFDQRRQKEVQANKRHIEEQIEDHKKRMEKLEDYINTCISSLDENRKQEEQLINEIESGKLRMAEVNEELNGIVGELQNARIDFHEGKRQKMKAEILDSMKRMYPDAVFGRLFELCHPIHKKYQMAITKVLGRYMYAIVVSTEKVARDCIRFLKEERAEPETFLSLDYLSVKPINEKLREIKGSKMMIDVIQTATTSLKKVIQFVCGNGLVCETVKEARHIAFDGPERIKTVALDGTLFLKSGIISGGSSDLRFKAKRWDEKEINELKEKKDSLMNELRELMKLRRKESDLKQLEAQLQGTQTRFKYSQSELDVIKKKQLASSLMEKSRLESELANCESQLTMLREELDTRTVKIEDLQEQMNKVEDGVFREFCEEIGVSNIRQYEEEHVKQQQETDKKRLEFENQKTRLGIQLEYSRGQLEKEVRNMKKLQEAVSAEEEIIVKLKEEEAKVLAVVDETLREQKQLKNVLILKKAELADAQKLVDETRKELLNLNREIGRRQKESMAIESLLEQKKLERHNLLLDCKVQNIGVTLLAGSLDDITEIELETEGTQETADIYEREANILIDYSELPDDLKNLTADKDIAAELMKLRQETITQESTLLKTSAPNLKALEKLNNVREKFQETADAFEASRMKARLCRHEFEQVKQRRYELFNKCFEHVSIAIDQIYKQLCRNSSAQAFLSPENPEEPYLEGIGYNCVAPGKRFMPMDNLSGGEKSVAALALVFAIHSFRPAPFFILDEVDAALDNTNIGKVTSYIREQSRQHLQMVVISLKEEFYSTADALIGVSTEQDEYVYSIVLTLDLTMYAEEDESDGKEYFSVPPFQSGI
ncbi:structural maintenance of chromosomes protein 1B [Spea bombifrons]|uniref:structural maintenance of chromosomes protein 1B n=1 Tax=Spea bombifrons TaxID=233779 RepID=UPI002348F788|nr:structural maintenance of chromosomes protein 1B [Spea bombifrons]